MALTRYKLGDLIELCEAKNDNLEYGIDDVKGISIQKIFIETKADMSGVSLKPYYLVQPDDFAYVTVTSRNGEKITIAHNMTDKTYIVSSSYIVFCVKAKELILSDFLFMYFNRPEFDRYSRFNSWGSARETFSWEDMCDIEIDLPPLAIQQKYVDVYNAMLANQKCYERGLEDLKLVCDAYIEDLRRKIPCEEIGKHIEESVAKNTDGKYGIEFIKGVSIKKEFIETKANTNDLSTTNYNIAKKGHFSFNPNTARMGDKFCIAYNNTNNDILVSSIYPVFYIKEKTKLSPEYLMLFFMRSEFDRYVRFNSWGSAREMFNYEDITHVKIPIPNYNVQQAIVYIFTVFKERKYINEKLKNQIKDICPILIKGSIEEARKEA